MHHTHFRAGMHFLCYSETMSENVKIKHFEFWNTHLFHFPIYLYWIYLSVKARSLFFFSAANPGIETGGLMGESKYNILRQFPPDYIPKTLFYNTAPSAKTVCHDLDSSAIRFPFVVKPDIGQGGWLIEMIHDEQDLERFLSRIRMPFMIQEFIDYPLELGILYYRYPGEVKGYISSVAIKELLNITGDGVSTIRRLVECHPRGRQQLTRLVRHKRIDLGRIPAAGETVYLSFIGNHSYGTKFLNGNNLIDAQLTSLFDRLCRNIEGFYFGRFDLRCASLEELRKGNFKILELNGVGSEPLHIFDPREKLWRAYRSALHHWSIIYKLSIINKQKGIAFMRLAEAWKIYREVRRIQQIHQLRFTIGN